MTRQIFRTALLFTTIWLVAACGTPPTPAPGQRETPTPLPTAAVWTEPAQALTLQIANDLRQLGTLEVPEPPSTVFGYALSPDQTVLAGLNTDWVLVWDLVRGELLFNAPSRSANRLYFSPDKDEIFTVNRGGVIEVFNAANGNVKDTFAAFSNYSNIAVYEPGLGLLALSGMDGTFQVWDMPARESLLTQATSAPLEITAMAFAPESGRLALGNEEGTVEIWDTQGSRVRQSQIETQARVSALLFSPDERFLVTSSPQNTIVWDLATGARQHVLDTGGTGDVLTFVPDSPYLLTNTGGEEILAWDMETGEVVAALSRDGQDRLSVAASPDGQMLFVADLGGSATLWSLENLAEGAVGRANLNVPQTTIFNVVWSEDSFLVLFFDTTGPIHVWGVGSQ